MHFASLLTAYTLRANVSQNELARTSGVEVGTVNRFLHGSRLPARPLQILMLASALKLCPGDIDRLLVAANFPATECRDAARTRYRMRRDVHHEHARASVAVCVTVRTRGAYLKRVAV